MASELQLTQELTDEINGAFASGRPFVLAYIDGEGYPRLSHRGSTHVHSSDQLAIWARNPEGGCQRAIAERPKVALYYFRPDPLGLLSMTGRARVSPEDNDAVWEATPQRERDLDPERRGVAVIIDLDSVQGLGPDGFFAMTRDGDA
jgi:hypothetical protein